LFSRNLISEDTGRGVEDIDTVNLNDINKDAIRSPFEETPITLKYGKMLEVHVYKINSVTLLHQVQMVAFAERVVLMSVLIVF
jgi:hypothetical protein